MISSDSLKFFFTIGRQKALRIGFKKFFASKITHISVFDFNDDCSAHFKRNLMFALTQINWGDWLVGHIKSFSVVVFEKFNCSGLGKGCHQLYPVQKYARQKPETCTSRFNFNRLSSGCMPFCRGRASCIG